MKRYFFEFWVLFKPISDWLSHITFEYFHLRLVADILTTTTHSWKLLFLSFFLGAYVSRPTQQLCSSGIWQTFIVWLFYVKCYGQPQGRYKGFTLLLPFRRDLFSGRSRHICNCSRAGDDKGRNIVQTGQDSLCKHHSRPRHIHGLAVFLS